jgi:hypothetical protein
MTARLVFPVLVLVIVVILFSGCMQVRSNTPLTPTVVPSMTPGSTVTVTSGFPFPLSYPVPVTTTTSGAQTIPSSLPEEKPDAVVYRHFQDADYSLDYPSSWQYNETTPPLREYIHTLRGCSVKNAYQLDQKLRMFFSRDGDVLFYSSVVDSERDIWPRDLTGQIVYADVINSVLGNPDYCANTPEGAFVISGVALTSLSGVSFEATRVDFGKINRTGYPEGTGTAYIITGNHQHGVFTFYSATGSPGAGNAVAGTMFNSIRLDSGF